ncbi:MAG TPA: ornithine cyclodeaminase family protein [Dehalococcoidia bacterium]|nr:ornithine cyclodeaminase family protein [Dehalococcoidia bacterium]
MPTHPIIVSENDIMPLLTDPAAMDEAIDAVEKSTLAEYAGRVRSIDMTDRTQTEPSNFLQIHLATDDEFVTGFQVFGATPGQPRTNSRFVVLLDAASRQFMGIVPYEGLSPLRVGASAGVAARYLAPKDARIAAIIGSSKQARRQLHAIVRAVPTVKEARVYSPTPEHRQTFAAEMADFLGIDVRAVDSAEDAVRDADIVDSSTNTKTPVLEWDWIKPGALVMQIGGDQLPAEVLQQRIFVPTWDSTEDEATGREPFGSAIRAGKLKREDIAGELGQAILGEVPARERDDQTVVFDVGRINIWAVAVTHWAYEWAREREIGTPVALSAT